MKYRLKDYCLISYLFPIIKYRFNIRKFKKEYLNERFLYLSFPEYLKIIKPDEKYISNNIKTFSSIFLESYIYKQDVYLPVVLSLIPKKNRFENIKKRFKDYKFFFELKRKKKLNNIYLLYEDLLKMDLKINIMKNKNYSIFDLLKLIIINEENLINAKLDKFLLTNKSTFLLKNLLVWFLSLKLDSLKYIFIQIDDIINLFKDNFEIFIHSTNLNIKEIKEISKNYNIDGYILSKFEYYELIKNDNKYKFLEDYKIKNNIKIRYASYYIDDDLSLSETPGYIIF